jgi:hypothetical protein
VTIAVERVRWRFGAYEQVCAACSRTRVSLSRFFSLRPERLRLRFGESARQSQVPVIFAPDLAERVSAMLPPRTLPPTTGAMSLERDALRRYLGLAQLDGDLDVVDVVGWDGVDGFVSMLGRFYDRLFEEARACGEGEETASFFQLLKASVLRNVLLHHLGPNERFLGLAGLLAYLDDRALAAQADRHDALSARLGLLLMAASSPLSLMGAAPQVAARPGNVYRTVPAAFERAQEIVRAEADTRGGLDLFAVRPRLAAELLADPAHRGDLVRSMLAEAVRDCALLSTLTQGSELRDIAGRSAALTEALFSPLGPEKLKARLARHPRAGEGALGRLDVLASSVGAILAGDVEHVTRLGSVEARADIAATGALVLALDELALDRGTSALGSVRPVPALKAEQARRDGRAYWFGVDDEPLYLIPKRRAEAFFFVDMKDFTKRTAAIQEDAMGDFLKRRFYDPILRMCTQLARGQDAHVDVVNLLGDAVAARGDIVSMVALTVSVRRLLAEAAEELAQGARALGVGDEVLAEIELELSKAEQQLTGLPRTDPKRVAVEDHIRGLRGGREQRLSAVLGGGLEAGVFVTWGPQATVIEAGSPEVGEWRVFIAEYLNAAARGTNRSAPMSHQRDETRLAAEEEAGGALIDPFSVFTSADPLELSATHEFHNAGAALTAEALDAYRERSPELSFSDVELRRATLPVRLRRYWLPRPLEELVLCRDAKGRPALLFRRTGRTIFRGLEASGGTDIWEIVLVERGFGSDVIASLGELG